RELTSYDYAYAIKRVLDPNLRSPNNWMFEGKLLGLQSLIDQARQSGHFNYDQAVAGIETPDRYTLILRLNQPDHNFSYILAHAPSSAVAREVIEKYKDKAGYVMGHPVGTGPYQLAKWTPASRIILKANPDYRGFVWNFKASSTADQKIVDEMKGKHMPQIGTIDIRVMEEAQSRLLAFQKDELDMFSLDGNLVQQALENGKLKPDWQKRGIRLSRISDPSIDYYYWNMKNPVVGGYSKDKIALRRAMSMAFDRSQYIKLMSNGDAKTLDYPIPYGVIGHDAHYKTSIPYSVKAANLLLDRYNYKVGANGWRTLPNGKPLVIEMNTLSDSRGQQQAELWKKTLDNIKIQMVSKSMPFADMLKAEKQCKTMFRPSAWYADYPDGDNFMQLFYGKNIHATNNSCFSLPEYDRLYAQSQKLAAGPERDLLYHKMTRLLEVYSAVRVISVRYRNVLTQPRVIGFKKSPVITSEWMYMDIQR
ncbi:MAG: ABC transporter substrate-binding protein, partial [Acinetobacter sp.]